MTGAFRPGSRKRDGRGVFAGFDSAAAANFAGEWLPAWTGNDPQRLLSFYAADGFYRDPAVPQGLRGHGELAPYFEKLLARFPDWSWRQISSDPLPDGFLNHWEANIPVRHRLIVCRGACTVIVNDDLIVRNEVFFDRSELLDALRG